MQKIAIHSVPRSGSSWLGQIFNSSRKVIYKYQPLFSYAFKDYLDEHSAREQIETFFEEVAQTEDPFLDQTDKVKAGSYPDFEKSESPTVICYKEVRYHHILPNMMEQADDVKVIGLIRNPCAVINSWLQAPKEFRREEGWDEMEEWRHAPKKNRGRKEEFHGFEKWKEAARIFHQLNDRYSDRFHLIRYSDLLDDTLNSVRRLFDFCDLKVESQTLEFLESSRDKKGEDPYGVYRKNPGNEKWKYKLNPAIRKEIIRDLKDTELEQYLYG